MRRLRTSVELVRHLARRIPVVIREGRVPRGPRELAARLRQAAHFATFLASGARPDPSRLPLPPPRRAPGLRLLFLSHNLNLEGAPIFQLLLAAAIRQDGHDVRVLAPTDGPLRPRYAASGVPVYLGDALRRVRDGAAYRNRMSRIGDWARRGGFDLVFANTLQSFWGVAVARAAGLPSVWAIHESVDWERAYFADRPAPIRDAALAALRTGATRLVFAADATRRLYAALDAPGRLVTIPYGLDREALDRFIAERPVAAAREAHGVPPDARVVTVVGTTCERKGQIDFLRMARLLERAGRRGLRFLVVGARPSEYLRGLEAFVREARLASVTLVPETPDVYDYFRMSDVFVCSSYEESLPVVVLEAMGFGLPIVSTDVFGIPEALTDGESGLLVQVGDVDALAAAVGRVLDDPGLASRLGMAARARFDARFTQERMAQAYASLFAECVRR